MNDGRVDGLTDHIETPHVLEAPPIIAASKHPRQVVREGNRVRAKPVGRENAPDWSLTPVHHRWWRGFDILHIR